MQGQNGHDRSDRTGLAHLALLACDHCALQRLGKAGLGYINTLTLGSQNGRGYLMLLSLLVT